MTESLNMLKAKFAPKAMLGGLLGVAAAAVHAAGPSGTESVAEMQLTGTQLGLLFAGAVALGVVIWLVMRFLNK